MLEKHELLIEIVRCNGGQESISKKTGITQSTISRDINFKPKMGYDRAKIYAKYSNNKYLAIDLLAYQDEVLNLT